MTGQLSDELEPAGSPWHSDQIAACTARLVAGHGAAPTVADLIRRVAPPE
jgi:hypothetical protein